MEREKLVDKDKLTEFLQEMDCDEQLFGALISHLRAYFEELEGIKPKDDAETLRLLGNIAHKLKSSCDSFGCLQLKEIFFNMEKASRQNDFKSTVYYYDQAVKMKGLFLGDLQEFYSNFQKNINLS